MFELAFDRVRFLLGLADNNPDFPAAVKSYWEKVYVALLLPQSEDWVDAEGLLELVEQAIDSVTVTA
jgi:hypothetical protein